MKDYIFLLSSFVDGEMPVLDFQRAYLDKFKQERKCFDEETYEFLDALFGDVDAYTDDKELLAESPDYYLDEATLKARISEKIASLQNGTIQQRSPGGGRRP